MDRKDKIQHKELAAGRWAEMPLAGELIHNALGETGKGMVNYPVSQKRLGVSESCWREDQQQGLFF